MKINALTSLIKKDSKGGEKPPADNSRQMKFPYTFSAKIAQFPIKFYINNNWLWKYYLYGFLVSIPIFYKIHQMSNSPGNIEKWRLIKEKEAHAHEEHH